MTTPTLGAGPLRAPIANTCGMIAYSLPYRRMRSVKSAVLAACLAVALAACGSAVKPPQGHGKLDDPRTNNPNHVACLRHGGFPVQLVGRTTLQIGPLPSGPTVYFEPTPGAAQAAQIEAQAQGAEVIGSALLYPHGATDDQLTAIEACLAKGVTG